MFDKFGEFDSWEELNLAAEGQKAEGDKNALMELAKENGIDEEDALDFFEGYSGSLCTPLSAAIGKLELEEKELNPQDIMRDWIDYLKSVVQQEYIQYMEQKTDNLPICLGVRKKDKTIKGCIGQILKWSFKNMKEVDPDIKKAAGVTQNCKLGIPGQLTVRKLIRDYYLGR